MEIDFLSAFVIGLLGSGHCLAMCGGISTMLTTSLPSHSKKLPLVLSYNFGRICSYGILGAIAGLTGSLTASWVGLPIMGLKAIAGIFLILLGLYIGQWFMGLVKVEQIGKLLWQYISPFTKRFIPVNSIKKSFGLGTLWGWLPCGLVYSTLTWSMASGSTIEGAAIMICFGLGTLPSLLSVSLGVLSVKQLLSNIYFRKIAALSLVLYGVYTLKFAYDALF